MIRALRISARAAGLTAVSAIVLGMAGSSLAGTPSEAERWEGLLGGRPTALLGDRYIVLLRLPSLADRVRHAGGVATEAEMREFTAAARDAQKRVLFRLALRGVAIAPEHRYAKTVNGFSASLDPHQVVALETAPEVRGVWPVRAGYPAAVSDGALAGDALSPRAGRGIGLPGFDGTGVTVALLDTGVDVTHPFIASHLLPGIDVVEPGGGAVARDDPTAAGHVERHGTELAGLVVGSGGPRALSGVAPGASLLPIRIAGWQPDAAGDVAVYSRTDQVVAGIEAAVDPNDDGDSHDAVRIAVVGVDEPYAAFDDGPLARAVAGAMALDTLVVAPAGNDGGAGPSYGSVGGPGGSPEALTVGAVDRRNQSPALHVLVRAGLDVLVDGAQPLAGPVERSSAIEAPLVAAPRIGALRGWFENGFSLAAGNAVLLPPDVASIDAVRDAASAGARVVLVDGDLPAGSLGSDVTLGVPVFGVARGVADRMRGELRTGERLHVSVGATTVGTNVGGGEIAPFSSQGLSFGGAMKPEVAASGVGVATSSPGRGQDGLARYGTINGSSAAAAIVAGAAAVLAGARPDLDAAALKSVLVTTARPLENGGAGLLDLEAASAAEVAVSPPTLSFDTLAVQRETLRGHIVVRNISSRRLRLQFLAPRAGPASGISARILPDHALVLPGRTTTVGVELTPTLLPQAPGALRGRIIVRVENGLSFPVPWVIAVPITDKPLISRLVLARHTFAPSDKTPTVLSFVAGRVDGSADRPSVVALRSLTVDLLRSGRRTGTLVTLRDLLPGRYALGLTGRDGSGRRLAPGTYAVRITARAVQGGPTTALTTGFAIR